MKNTLLLLLVVGLSLPFSAYGAAPARAFSGERSTLTIDGVVCPGVEGWSGGEPRGETINDPLGQASSPGKHVGIVKIDPIRVELSVPFPAVVTDLINDFFASRTSRKTLVLERHDVGGKTIGSALRATGAQLSEVQFPALDATDRSAWQIVLVFVADSVQPTAGTDSAATSVDKAGGVALASNFQLQLEGIDTTRTSRIGALTVKRGVSSSALSAAGPHDATNDLSPTQFPQLIISMSLANSGDWAHWRNDFLLQGRNGPMDEKNGAITLHGANLREPLFSINLLRLGIVRLTTVPGAGDNGTTLEAELYCEGMKLGNASSTASNSTSANTSTKGPNPPPSSDSKKAATRPSRE